MARGQGAAADTQLNTTNAVGQGELNQANTLESELIPSYTSLMRTGYTSPAAESAATTSEMGAATQPFESMGFQAANRAGATKNAADLSAQQDKLALEEGQTAGTAAANLQNQKMRNQMAGMSGTSNLSEEDMRAMESMYGLGPGTLSARAAGPSGDQTALGYLNWSTGGGKG